ncbi:MAG: cation:dicarboxylate symporter family transporter, partial [Arsenophonus sp. NC-QC1-MAG3]
MKLKNLTNWIIISMITGIMVGFSLNSLTNAEATMSYAKNISIITDIFLRLIKMIIAPLIISTLIVGIAKMDDEKMFVRVFSKTLLLFIVASFIS